MKVDTGVDILVSFAYMGNNKKFASLVAEKVRSQEINLMIDSGAFTAYHTGLKKDFINVDNYCKFLETYGCYAEKYVMLDVIKDEKSSKDNYETMVKRGLKPMYVVTQYDNDFSYIEDTLDINSNICVAGGVNQPMNWCIARYQNVYYNTGNKARIHGLGFVKFPNMFKLPLASVDSSTWSTTSQKFGHAIFWENGVRALSWQQILKSDKKVPLYAQEQMTEAKITPSLYSQEKCHRGANSIDLFLSIIAYLKFQKYARHCKKKLFLAIGSISNLERILYVYENFHNLDYKKYVSYFKKLD